jgi:hypothetical protein
MQFREYVEKLFEFVIGAPWVRDAFWFFVAGAPWARGSTPEWKYPDMQLICGALGHAAVLLVAVVVAGLAMLGLWRFTRSGWSAFTLCACALAAPCLHVIYVRAQKIFIFEWYIIYALPFVAILWGVGAVTLSHCLAGGLKRPSTSPLVVALLVGSYAFLIHPVHAWHFVHSKTPHRESVLSTRSNPGKYRSAENRRIITACVGSSPSLAYDPRLLQFNQAAELAFLCKHADLSGRTLAVNIGHIDTTRQNHPRELAILQDRQLFGRTEFFGGADRVWDRQVYFYTPGSASSYDFTSVLTADELAWIEENSAKRPEAVFSKRK